MKTIILISAIILSSTFALGQDVLVFKGQVTDGKTQKPLADCHVYVSCMKHGTVTDENGNFTIELPYCYMTHCLVVSHMGYEKYIFPIHDLAQAHISIRLEEGTIPMAELVISPDHYRVIHRPEFEPFHADQLELSGTDKDSSPADPGQMILEASMLNIF